MHLFWCIFAFLHTQNAPVKEGHIQREQTKTNCGNFFQDAGFQSMYIYVICWKRRQ